MKEFVRELRKQEERLFVTGKHRPHDYRPDGICVPPVPITWGLTQHHQVIELTIWSLSTIRLVEAPRSRWFGMPQIIIPPLWRSVRVGTSSVLFNENLASWVKGWKVSFMVSIKSVGGYDEEYAVGVVTVMVITGMRISSLSHIVKCLGPGVRQLDDMQWLRLIPVNIPSLSRLPLHYSSSYPHNSLTDHKTQGCPSLTQLAKFPIGTNWWMSLLEPLLQKGWDNDVASNQSRSGGPRQTYCGEWPIGQF